MVTVGKKTVSAIRLGKVNVIRIMAGSVMIWGCNDLFLHVSPDVLWLFNNDCGADTIVLSNTSWEANIVR